MTSPPGSGILAGVRRWLTGGRLRRASEAGYAAIMVAILVPTVGIGCAAVAVDTGVWYVEQQMAQKAADAAALAGVPFLPQDLPSAKTRALEVAARNGYDNNLTTNWVDVGLGDKPTQLKVTIKSIIKNTFGSVIGVPTITITQSGTADYQGPAPMGSPCNTFGNEPNAGGGGSSASPAGTAQGTSPHPNCSRTPQFWATVEGPETGKVQGDRYQTKKCENSGVDGCDGSKNNTEYDEFGYVFVVKVTNDVVNTPVELQLYDPMFTNTGQTCGLLPDSTAFASDTNNTNVYVKNNDARNRYSDDGASTPSFCTGDSYAGSGSGASPPHALTTSFVLRQQVDSQNPAAAPVQNDTSGNACIKQYASYNTSGNEISADRFKSASGSYDDELSKQFHNWIQFCTFTPTRVGDYYLQVRTNVSLGSFSGYIRSGNTAAAALTGNTTSGEGSNSFAIRAVTQTGKEKAVAVAGYNHMPIFVNSDNATVNFNLIRVLPGAAGQKISFSYFDAGDSQGAGSVQVVRPDDATGSILTTPFPGGCYAVGGSAGTGSNLTNCTAPFEKTSLFSSTSKNNGKTETITIPIPTDYSCNFASLGGCWYRVNVTFGGGGVHDVTTWDATVVGDPVRLVK